jgi:aspartate dehydrogenase
MRLLIAGCGAIGTSVARALDGSPEVGFLLLFDVAPAASAAAAQGLSNAAVIRSLDEGIAGSDVVLESATQAAAREILPKALGAGRHAVAMSVGALVDDDFRGECARLAREKGVRLVIPSGAIGGIDALQAACEAGLAEVRLTTRKPPAGFQGSEYVKRLDLDLSTLAEAKLLYSGPAREAVRLFPQNVNVAATVSIAGVGFDRTVVEVVCDPQLERNTHLLFARGAFGEFEVEMRNLPSPDNPKTSHLAALSAIRAVRRASGTGLVLG